jgi:AraC-like DNA-binding protein
MQASGSECVYEFLADQARARYPFARLPLNSRFFALLLTEGSPGLARCLGVSLRTLHRLLERDGLGALELRTWARREAVTILLSRRVPQAAIAQVTGFRTVATLQAFLRRELKTSTREARMAQRRRALAEDGRAPRSLKAGRAER